MITGQHATAAGLMRIIAYLMQRNQLIWERGVHILVDIFALEIDGVIEVGSLGHRMMTERIQMRHGVDRCECGRRGFGDAGRIIAETAAHAWRG